MAGIYIHIPFCKRICAYCDFYKSADTRLLEPTIGALCGELHRRRDYLGGERVETLYFGGGTPSLCSVGQIKKVIDTVRENFGCDFREVTLEANPDDLTPEYLDGLRRTGIDRLSIGIQSLDDGCLKLMNRRHTAAEAIEAVAAARRAGFSNITLDMIFGIAGYGGESLRRTVEGILAMEPEHVSAYHLTIEPQTTLGRRCMRGEFRAVDEATSEREFEFVHDTLTAAGYDHYEVSNFAREGRRARHNSAYWHGVKYLGAGPAAHSFNGVERHWNPSDTARYIAGEGAESEVLTERDRYNEYVMTRLRTSEGLSLTEISERFGRGRAERAERAARRWIEAGSLRREGERMAVPSRRFLLSDAVIESLFEG